MEREVEMKLPSKRKKKSPIGTSFRRVAISLLLVSKTRRDAAYFFSYKIMIHKISFALRPILACFLFISSISFDRSKKSRRRLKKWNEKPADIHNITLFRWSALCGGSRPEHRMKMSTAKKSRDIFLISTRAHKQKKRDKKKFIYVHFFISLLHGLFDRF